MSYGVVWCTGEGPQFLGKLEVHSDEARIDGRSMDGTVGKHRVSAADIADVRVSRDPDERLNELPTIVLRRRTGQPLRVAAVNGAGELFEMAGQLAQLACSIDAQAWRIMIRVPLNPGAHRQAQTLVREGPPFDPRAIPSLERHQVFITENDVIFIFEGPQVRDAISDLLRAPPIWLAGQRWRPLLAGSPRIIGPDYTWTRS